MRTRTLLAVLGILAGVGCGEHRRTVVVPADSTQSGTRYPAQPPTTSAPPQSGSTTPPSSGSVTPPPTSTPTVAGVQVTLMGPGPVRVASDAREVTGLALTITNAGPDAANLERLDLRARGLLDDARALTTLRLAEDTDGDGRFDRSVDRVLASAGFTQDDGVASFVLAGGVALNAGTTLRLVVALDLNGAGRANDDLCLELAGPSALAVTSPAGAVQVVAPPAVGPRLRLGGWVAPHLAFAVPGDGLFPRAVRDGNGNTHVAIYQNHNGNSDVWYSLFDGRSYSPVDQVTHAPGAAWNQDLAVDNGLPHLIWEEWNNAISDYAIRYCRFDATNFGWTQPEDVSAGAGTALVPRIVVAGGVVHAVWEQTPPAGTPRIFYRRRTAAGWSGIAEVSSAIASARADKPALALVNGTLTVAWAENGPTQSLIVTRELTPSGLGRRVVAASAASTAERPQLLAEGGELHLVFETQGEVYHARRTAQGWSQPTDVSRSPNATSSEAALVLHQGVVRVVWIEDETGASGNTATQVAHAAAQGGGFGPVELLTRGLGARSYPVAVSEGDRLKVLWQDWSLGRQRIFSTWQEPTRLEAPTTVAAPGGDPQRPEAAFGDAGRVVIAYGLDAGGNHEVFVQVADGSGGFSRAENASRSATPSYKPTVAVVGSSAWLAWEEELPTGFAVQVAHSVPTGYSTPATISSNRPAYGPRILAAAAGPVVVWTETDGSHHRITTRARTAQGWGAPAQLSPAGSDAWSPDAARTRGGALVAVWEDETAGRRRIRSATRLPNGAVSVAYVASSASAQWAPRVATRGEEVHVIWVEDGRVRVSRRAAGAATFDAPTDLSQGGSWSPDIAVAGATVVACWEQWTQSDARALHTTLTPQGWSTPAPLDLSRGPSKRTSLLGTARGGLQFLWTTPGAIWLRQGRED